MDGRVRRSIIHVPWVSCAPLLILVLRSLVLLILVFLLFLPPPPRLGLMAVALQRCRLPSASARPNPWEKGVELLLFKGGESWEAHKPAEGARYGFVGYAPGMEFWSEFVASGRNGHKDSRGSSPGSGVMDRLGVARTQQSHKFVG